jgi:hypothetical protein
MSSAAPAHPPGGPPRKTGAMAAIGRLDAAEALPDRTAGTVVSP